MFGMDEARRAPRPSPGDAVFTPGPADTWATKPQDPGQNTGVMAMRRRVAVRLRVRETASGGATRRHRGSGSGVGFLLAANSFRVAALAPSVRRIGGQLSRTA